MKKRNNAQLKDIIDFLNKKYSPLYVFSFSDENTDNNFLYSFKRKNFTSKEKDLNNSIFDESDINNKTIEIAEIPPVHLKTLIYIFNEKVENKDKINYMTTIEDGKKPGEDINKYYKIMFDSENYAKSKRVLDTLKNRGLMIPVDNKEEIEPKPKKLTL